MLLKVKPNNHRYIVIHEQPTSILPLSHCFSCPVKHVSGLWSDSIGKVIGLKITQRKKINCCPLGRFHVILVAVERRVLIEIKAGFAIFGALFLVQGGMRWAVLVDMPGFPVVWLLCWKPGWDSAPPNGRQNLRLKKHLGLVMLGSI